MVYSLTESADEGVDSCNGDSGGGLIFNLASRPVLIGVTSLGSPGCRGSLPALYTNLLAANNLGNMR